MTAKVSIRYIACASAGYLFLCMLTYNVITSSQ
jgi:hypothetical protein